MIMSLFKNLVNKLLNIFYPIKCPYCGKIIDNNDSGCAICLAKIRNDGLYKLGLVKVKNKFNEITFISPFRYKGIVRDAIIRFKFRKYRGYAKQFATEISRFISLKFKNNKFDMITYVPLSESIGKKMNLNLCTTLKKIKSNKQQHELKASERAVNVKGVYVALYPELIEGKNILLCDDILTTGNTLMECSKVLYEAGASSVTCVTAAYTDENIRHYDKAF